MITRSSSAVERSSQSTEAQLGRHLVCAVAHQRSEPLARFAPRIVGLCDRNVDRGDRLAGFRAHGASHANLSAHSELIGHGDPAAAHPVEILDQLGEILLVCPVVVIGERRAKFGLGQLGQQRSAQRGSCRG